jgi:hypothetical protein
MKDTHPIPRLNKKTWQSLIIFIIILFLIPGCTQKIKTAAPYKTITIVYGLLDMADTAHYIRIEKAFSSQDQSAVTLAKNPDSSLLPNINVHVEMIDFSGNRHDTIHLNRVDLNLEGYQKQPGVFFTAPNYAYKFTNKLDPNYIYRLIVTNLVSGETDSADAPVIVNGNDSIFSVGLIDYPGGGIDFSRTASTDPLKITGSYANVVTDYNFEGQGIPVGFAQAIIRFNWTDSNTVTRATSDHYYDFYLSNIIPLIGYPGASFEYDLHNIELYLALYTGMGAAPPNTYRLIGNCDLFAYLSTTDFYNYEAAQLSQGTGLTEGTIEPIETNVKGAHALGLFTARAFKTGKLAVSYVTIDSIMKYPLFANANVAGASNH